MQPNGQSTPGSPDSAPSATNEAMDPNTATAASTSTPSPWANPAPGSANEQSGYQQPTSQQPATPQLAYVREAYLPPLYPEAPYQPLPAPRQYPMRVVVVVAIITALVCGIGGVTAGAVFAVIGKSSTEADRSVGNPVLPKVDGTDSGPVITGDGQALLARILLPPGATVKPVTGTTGGVMNLDQYLTKFFSTSTTERGLLEARGFQVAAIRAYQLNGLEVITHLVQFDETDGAESFILGQIAARARDVRTTSTFDVPNEANAMGFDLAALNSVGNRSCYVLAQVGNVAVMVEIVTPGKLDRVANLKAMTDQIAALR